jgi:glyoxylase-like metal-dependent hydrolase (beta-lactamase superfamily II)
MVTKIRMVLAPAFLLCLGWSYQRSVPAVVPVITEEGQPVVFAKRNWQMRELAKRLPLDEPWPTGSQVSKVLQQYGLDQTTLSDTIPKPARIMNDVYLVGQDRFTNRTYLIDCGGGGVAIIDPSWESEFDATVVNIEKCGYSRKNIRWVINTHCHADHSMADRKFRELGAEIMVPEADADAVEKGTLATGYGGNQPGEPQFPTCKVDRRLSDGEELHMGNKVLYVIHTPGHTPGSACFLMQLGGKKVLISGDTVFFDGQLGATTPYSDHARYLNSLEKLEKFTLHSVAVRWDMLLPGHDVIVMDRAYLDVQKDRETLGRDVATGSEVFITPHRRIEYRRRMFGRPATTP